MAYKVTKNYGKFAIIKDTDWEKWFIVDVENSQTIYGSYFLKGLKWDCEALESGAKTVESFENKWNHDYKNPIDMPKSLKAKQAQMQKKAAAQVANDKIPDGSTVKKIIKSGEKFAIIEDEYGGFYTIELSTGRAVASDVGDAEWLKSQFDSFESGKIQPSQYKKAVEYDIDFTGQLPPSLGGGPSKPIGSHAPSIVEVTDKGAYKIAELSDGTYGMFVPSTGESKMGFSSKQGASFSGSHAAKKHAAEILNGQGVDAGADAVDTLIDLYEGRVREMYGQAYREMAAKQAKFMERFHAQQAEMIAKLDAGEITQEQLRSWYVTQSAVSTANTQMVNTLANDLHEADKRAMQMLNGYMMPAYAENFDFATFQIEQAANVSTSFSLYNRNAIAEILKDPDSPLLPTVDDAADMAWCRRKVSSCIAQSILQGESVPNAAKRLQSVVGMGANSAVRAARTALTGAQNLGRMDAGRRAKAMGIELKKQWVATADARTRHSHRAIDRETVELEEKFSNGCDCPGDPTARGEEVWNCFLGETVAVPLGGIERSYKHLYRGDAVTVKTASGVEFTCTPNHPILTSEGWVAAGLLDDGDHLLVADLGNALGRPRVEPDVQHVGTRMDAIHELADMLASQRAGGLSVYFHEDVPTCDVDVVTEERPLRLDFETLRLEPRGEIRLKRTDPLAFCNRTEMEFVGRPPSPPDGLMGGGSEPGTLGWGSIRHALKHGLRAVPGRYSTPFESAVYETATDTELVRDCLDGLSALVKLDDVVDVHVGPVACHVYNLQTESGAYLVSGTGNGNLYAMSHNCRCAMRYVLPGHEYDDIPDKTREGEDYEKWKDAKKFEEQAKKDKLQAEIDAVEAQKSDLLKTLPEDETFAANEILKHQTSLSKWEHEQSAIADSKKYCEDKLAIASSDKEFFKKQHDHYTAKLAAIEEYDAKGKAYHDAKAAVQGQLDALDARKKELGAELAKLNQSPGGGGPFSAERLAAGRRFATSREADDALREISGRAWREATRAERRAINTYTGGAYTDYNTPLGGYKGSYRNFVGMDQVDINDLGRGQEIRDMTRMIERSITEEDMWLRRGVGRRTMSGFFGLDPTDDITLLSDAELQSFVGMSNRIGAFQSCGTTFDTGFTHKPVTMEIFVPKGSEAMYVEPISKCGNGAGLSWDGVSPQSSLGGELETIIQRGGSYTCAGIRREDGKLVFTMELHPEDGYWKFQQ